MRDRAAYRPVQRVLHWSIAALVLLAYLFVEQRSLFERGSDARAAMLQSHYWAGVLVLLFSAWRIGLRLRYPAPPISPPLPIWQAGLAQTLHASLYAFLLAMPLLGLATAWSDGKAVYAPFTTMALPALLPADPVWAERLEEWHGAIGEAFYWVIGAHVLAALYHHWMRRDDSLRRML